MCRAAAVLSLSFVFFFLGAFGSTGNAQTSFTGFLRHETGVQHTRSQDVLFSRNIIQAVFSSENEDWTIQLTPWLAQRNPSGEAIPAADLRIREAYVGWESFTWQIRAGRQFIPSLSSFADPGSDFFVPYDFSEFLSRDPSDIDLGVNALRVQHYRLNNTFELMVIPVFQPSTLPDIESRWNIIPLDAITGGVGQPVIEESNRDTDRLQFGLRWSNRTWLKWDFNATLYSGYYPQPAFRKEVLYADNTGLPRDIALSQSYVNSAVILLETEYRSNRNWVSGAALTYWSDTPTDTFPVALRSDTTLTLNQLLETIESYNQTAFTRSSGLFQAAFFVQKTLVGTQFRLGYTAQLLENHQKDTLQDFLFQSISLNASRQEFNDYLQMLLLGRFNINGRDAWVSPQLTYTVFDGVALSAGSHFFIGTEPDPFYAHLSFAPLRQNSFSYLKLTAYW